MFNPTVLRGQIQHRERKQQIADMSGLRWGKITPTDIDAAIEMDDRLFGFIEGKFVGTPISFGQSLWLERACDAIHQPPRRYAFAIIADHCQPSNQDIDFANMQVRTWRFDGVWRKPMQKGIKLIDAVNKMIAFVENKQGRALYRRAA
jgi:hypothetical protein